MVWTTTTTRLSQSQLISLCHAPASVGSLAKYRVCRLDRLKELAGISRGIIRKL